MKRVIWWSLFALALLLAPASQPALADSHEASPSYMLVLFEQVEPRQVEAYEKVGHDWVSSFKGAEMGKSWAWYASQGEDFTYAYVIPVPSYAALGEGEAREKQMAEKLGKEKVEHLMGAEGAIRKRWSILLKERPDLSYAPKTAMAGPPGHVQVSTAWVRPHKGQAYEDLLARVRDAFAKAEHPLGFYVHQVEFGQGSYVVVVEAESRAQYHSMQDVGAILAKGAGPEAAKKMFGEWMDMVVEHHSSGWTPRPDLSYMPGTTAAEGDGEGAE